MDQDKVMDHWSNPVNKGPLAGATHAGFAVNPGCGDTLRIDFRLVTGIMEAVGFDGKGCVMSLAGGSMLVEWLQEQKVREDWLLTMPKLLTPDEEQSIVKTIYGGLPIPVRWGCAFLPLRALQNVKPLTMVE